MPVLLACKGLISSTAVLDRKTTFQTWVIVLIWSFWAQAGTLIGHESYEVCALLHIAPRES